MRARARSTIKLTNAAFQQRVASCEGALEFLRLVGFEPAAGGAEGEALTLPAEKLSIAIINAAGGELNNALTNPYFGML
jgi:hypothetical protein